MKHGTKLRRGFLVGQRVHVTGDCPTHLRVRLYIPTSNDTVVVWAKFTEVS